MKQEQRHKIMTDIIICPECGKEVNNSLVLEGPSFWLFKSRCPYCNFALYDKEWFALQESIPTAKSTLRV